MKYFVIINASSPYGVEMLKKPHCLLSGPHPVLVGKEIHTDGMHYLSVVLDPELLPGDPTVRSDRPVLRTETYIPHSAVVAIQAGGDSDATRAFGFVTASGRR